MGIYTTKSKFQSHLSFVVDFLVAHHVSADAITLGAIVVSLIAALLLAFSPLNPALLLIVPVLLLGRLLLNVLDGMVARANGTAHKTGELLNEFGDRLSDLLIFAGLAVGTAVQLPSHQALCWLAISLILLSSYTDILGKSISGRRTYRGIMAKGDRMIWLSACALWVGSVETLQVTSLPSQGVWFVCWLVLIVGAVITTAQRLKGVYDAC